MRQMLAIGLIILLGTCLGACNSAATVAVEPVQPAPTVAHSPTLLPQASITAQTLLQNWLAQKPCAAPCWQQITPNTTTITDVVTLLPQEPLWVEPTRIETTLLSGTARGFIEWETGNHSGTVQFNPQSQPAVVETLKINFNERFSLAQVIESYGNPSHVFVNASTGEHNEAQIYYDISLLYLDQGFALDYYAAPITRDTPIDETIKFATVDFFFPSDEGLSLIITGTPFLEAIESDDRRLVQWQGFQPLGFYCDIAYGSQAAELCG